MYYLLVFWEYLIKFNSCKKCLHIFYNVHTQIGRWTNILGSPLQICIQEWDAAKNCDDSLAPQITGSNAFTTDMSLSHNFRWCFLIINWYFWLLLYIYTHIFSNSMRKSINHQYHLMINWIFSTNISNILFYNWCLHPQFANMKKLNIQMSYCFLNIMSSSEKSLSS